MTNIVGLFVCPCFAGILAAMFSYVARYGLLFLGGCVSQSIYVLGLLGLHLNLSHTVTSRPLGKSTEHLTGIILCPCI